MIFLSPSTFVAWWYARPVCFLPSYVKWESVMTDKLFIYFDISLHHLRLADPREGFRGLEPSFWQSMFFAIISTYDWNPLLKIAGSAPACWDWTLRNQCCIYSRCFTLVSSSQFCLFLFFVLTFYYFYDVYMFVVYSKLSFSAILIYIYMWSFPRYLPHFKIIISNKWLQC